MLGTVEADMLRLRVLFLRASERACVRASVRLVGAGLEEWKGCLGRGGRGGLGSEIH